jgi:hypothetical protein
MGSVMERNQLLAYLGTYAKPHYSFQTPREKQLK